MQWNSLPAPLSSQPSPHTTAPFCPLSSHTSMCLNCPRHRQDASAMNAPDIEVYPLWISHSCSSFYPLTRLSSACGSGLRKNLAADASGELPRRQGSCVQLVSGEGTYVFWPECHIKSDVKCDEAQTFKLRNPPYPLPHKFLRMSTHWPLFSAAAFLKISNTK